MSALAVSPQHFEQQQLLGLKRGRRGDEFDHLGGGDALLLLAYAVRQDAVLALQLVQLQLRGGLRARARALPRMREEADGRAPRSARLG